MQENAMFFEDQAVTVQEVAEQDDRDLAKRSVDFEQYLFWGLTLLDVAVMAKCYRFVQTVSCTEAIHMRLYGDLSPYDTNLSWLGALAFLATLGIFCPTWREWLIAVALSGFVLFILKLVPATFPLPRIVFTLPPRSNSWRGRTQKRSIPQGFPRQPSQNEILLNLKSIIQFDKRRSSHHSNDACSSACHAEYHSKFTGKWHIDISSRGIFFIGKGLKKLLDLDDAGAAQLTDCQLNQLWSPTFGFMEQIQCFLCAPHILFLFNGIQTILVTLCFSLWFISSRLGGAAPNLSPYINGQEQGMEFILLSYFACSLARDLMRLQIAVITRGWLDGFRNFLVDKWNPINIASGVTFLFGFYEHQRCLANQNLCFSSDFRLRGASQSEMQHLQDDNREWSSLPWDMKLEVWNLSYALCIFVCWWRVLQVFYLSRVGHIFSIFVCMFYDVLNWLVVYVILLCGFSMLFLGASDIEGLIQGIETCDSGLGEQYEIGPSNITRSEAWGIPAAGWASCHWSYIFIRPMFQSFGEFSLSEMKTAPSLIFLIFTFLVLNLVLMNLLIAMMAGIYEQRSQRAKSTRLLDTYKLLMNNSCVAVAAPPPLNIIIFMASMVRWFWHYKAIKRTYPFIRWQHRFEMFLSGDWGAKSTRDNNEQSEQRNIFIDLGFLSLSVSFGRSRPWWVSSAESHRGNGGSVRSEQQKTQQRRQWEADAESQKHLSDFMARARSLVLNQGHPKTSLEGKIDNLSSEIKHMQTVQEAIRRQVQDIKDKTVTEQEKAELLSALKRSQNCPRLEEVHPKGVVGRFSSRRPPSH
jgi:hypothetical protein